MEKRSTKYPNFAKTQGVISEGIVFKEVSSKTFVGCLRKEIIHANYTTPLLNTHLTIPPYTTKQHMYSGQATVFHWFHKFPVHKAAADATRLPATTSNKKIRNYS